MKKCGNMVLILILTLVLALTGCGGSSKKNNDNNNDNSNSAGKSVAYKIDSVTFNMNYVPGSLTFPTDSSENIYKDDTTATVANAYWIADTEVTYELWRLVYTWGLSHGYNFANTGRQGSDKSTDGSAVGTNQHPVTTISWEDAIVWCNALTEYYNAKNGTSYACVYYEDSAYADPIRSTSDSNIDTPYIYASATGNTEMAYCTAKGFRLPTNKEWELAARYIRDSNGDGDICDSGESYPGDHVSGDTTGYLSIEGSMPIIEGESESTVFGNYGWYDGNSEDSTHIVGTAGTASTTPKTGNANALGLYDMSGNVMEWCFDKNDSGRVERGGSWRLKFLTMMIDTVVFYGYTYGWVGFRPVRTN